jgi:hypothetical protein
MADPRSTLPEDSPRETSGGFIALAVVAAAVGAGAALLLAPDRQLRVRRPRTQIRREKRIVAVAGFLVGAGLTALLTPESGPATRKLLGGTLSRMKVGAIDRIERIRLSRVPDDPEDPTVRSVQELGRDPNEVF